MAYDETFAEMLRTDLEHTPGLTEKRMFGGLVFLREGNMLFVLRGKGGAMARVGADQTEAALTIDGVTPTQMRGRAMTGFVTLEDEVLDDDDRRAQLIAMAQRFVASLPPKA